MSFSGTPLGQGRRLDHHTFLGKPPSNGSLPAPSYAYGAPALGSRSPPKPTSPSRPRSGAQVPEDGLNDENETTLQRFAKLKQRDSAGDLNFRPSGPKTQGSSLNPAKLPRDTTVNVANAFFQAANGPDMSVNHNNPHNNSWASSSRERVPLPRDTSAEYEANVSVQTHKRLAAPPDKLGRAPTTIRKPPSKSTSSLHVPDPEGDGDSRGLNGRAKSPFETSLTFAKNALGAAAFYVRQRSREPEEHSIEQPPNGATNGNGNDSSYDYAEEEQAYQTQKRNNAAHKRNRMSVDNKAYKPSQSDEEESEYSDDGKTRRRRRKAKKGPAGGPLTSLPVVGSDKRRRRKGHGSKGNLGGPDEDDSDSEENTQMDIQSQSAQLRTSVTRTSNPPFSRASVPRFSVEPPEDEPDESMISANQGLDSIPEIDEALLPAEPEPPVRQSSQRRGRSRTPALQPSSSSFSLGGLLGSIVHIVIKLSLWLFSGLLSVLGMSSFLFGQVFGTTFDIMLRRPVGWARSASHLLKYLMPALVLLGAWYILQSASLGSYIPSLSFPSQTPVYQAPVVPPANIAELTDRLLRIENTLSGLAADTKRTKAKTEDGIRVYSDVLGRLGSVEGRLYEETKRIKDAEAKARDAVSRTINGVKQEVEVLQSQIVAQQKQHEKDQRTPAEVADEDARAKLRALEERLGGIEGGVKEALELGKKASSAVPPSAAGAAWWNKLASSSGSKSVLQIKSADGQDVSALISHLVDSAVSLSTKDGGIAKPDYALHSGGARVVPKLTSDILEIAPRGLGNQLLSLITGSGGYTTRSPVTALHHEMHPGHCWPLAGDQGRLGVALAAPIYVEEVTIDHIAAEVAYDMRSAPREMEVWGMLEGQDNLERVDAWKAERAAKRKEAGLPDDVEEDIAYPPDLPKRPEFIRLANFTYDIHAPNNVQTFPVDPEIKDLGVDFGIVVLRVLSNWGQDYFTCLYRFRVHGQRMGGIPGPLFGDGKDESSSS